jgi:hypothetical protein
MEIVGPTTDGVPLAFRLPAFCRVAWTGEAARNLWEPRLDRVRAALEDFAVLGAKGRERGRKIAVRPASLDRLRALAATAGVAFATIDAAPAVVCATATGTAGRLWIQVGAPGSGSRETPPLCRSDCSAVPPGPDACEARDPVWEWARRTSAAEPFDAGHGLAAHGRWQVNPLLRAIGLAPGPSWPCCAVCRTAMAEASALAKAAQAYGRAQELVWLEQILSWPASWSALHGIAEVKTPVFRYVRDTVATGERLTVHWLGTVVPETAARGLTFPLRTRPRTRPIVAARSVP